MERKRSKRSIDAERAFRERLTIIGATPIYDKWIGVDSPHDVVCKLGHKCTPRPSNVKRGHGICYTCAGLDSQEAERKFRERLAAIGATPLYERWEGNHKSYKVLCVAGHECFPYPGNVRTGKPICSLCTGRHPEELERRFREDIASFNATPMFAKWEGSGNPHKVICVNGHECFPRPSETRQGTGICPTCSRRDTAQAERQFREDLKSLNAKPLYETWLGIKKPHKVLCAAGHVCFPRPNGVQQGRGVCRLCVGKIWDVFYIVTNKKESIIKFGITSGNPKTRLDKHASDGFIEQVRILSKLPLGIARKIECLCLSTLLDAGMTPVRGREYFDIAALPTVLDIVDNYPITG